MAARHKKRSTRISLTNEARVLRLMRLQANLSMRQAGRLIGLSDSYIAHLETGRMDVPRGPKLDRILGAYGSIKQKSFFEKVRSYKLETTDHDRLLEIIERSSSAKIATLLAIAQSL